MTPLKTDSHTFLSFSEPQAWLCFLDSVNSKPICHLIWRSAKHALECIWQERRRKKKHNLILGVWLFPVDCISSWVALQWPVCVCVYLYVCGQGTGCPKRNGHGATLSCPALLLQIHKAHSLALQLAPCPLPVALSSLSIYLILSVFLLLLLSVCSDNFDPTLCIITPSPPTEKRQPAHFCLFGNKTAMF